VSPGDNRLVIDIEKLLKRKLEIEPLEYEEDRPRGRINDGRRAWRQAGDEEERRERSDDRRERYEDRRREPRQATDPFFDQPYQPPQREEAAAWEANAKPVGNRVSANIKPKRKVAALFKSGE
jgi:ATP-dependent RNA helicase RhlE